MLIRPPRSEPRWHLKQMPLEPRSLDSHAGGPTPQDHAEGSNITRNLGRTRTAIATAAIKCQSNARPLNGPDVRRPPAPPPPRGARPGSTSLLKPAQRARMTLPCCGQGVGANDSLVLVAETVEIGQAPRDLIFADNVRLNVCVDLAGLG